MDPFATSKVVQFILSTLKLEFISIGDVSHSYDKELNNPFVPYNKS